MNEVDVTDIINRATADGLTEYSASVSEIGEDAGRITWGNCLGLAKEMREKEGKQALPIDAYDDWKDNVAGHGAWSRKEIAGWDADETNALFIQFVVGDYRQFVNHADADWDEYERMCEKGRLSGTLRPGTNGRIYYSF